MIIFNGMYFRGSWKKPFDVVEPGMFYKSNTLKKQVPMMKTTGVYKTGSLPGLDSTAIELPYDVCIYRNIFQYTLLQDVTNEVPILKRVVKTIELNN